MNIGEKAKNVGNKAKVGAAVALVGLVTGCYSPNYVDGHGADLVVGKYLNNGDNYTDREDIPEIKNAFSDIERIFLYYNPDIQNNNLNSTGEIGLYDHNYNLLRKKDIVDLNTIGYIFIEPGELSPGKYVVVGKLRNKIKQQQEFWILNQKQTFEYNRKVDELNHARSMAQTRVAGKSQGRNELIIRNDPHFNREGGNAARAFNRALQPHSKNPIESGKWGSTLEGIMDFDDIMNVK
jgi:hypothetical protein